MDNLSKIEMKNIKAAPTTGMINTFTLTELVFYFSLILNLLYSLYYPVYSALHDYYHIIILALTVLMYMSEFRIKVNISKTIILSAFLVLTIAAILINHSGLGLVITIICPLTIIYIFKNSQLNPLYINRIYILMLFGWIIAFFATFSYNARFFEDLETGIEVDGVNPNTIAIIIVFAALFLELYIDSTSKNRFFKTVIYIVSFYALYRTKSRTSLIAFAIILLIEFLIKKKILTSKKIGILIPVVVIIAGIIFPFIYTMLYTQGVTSYHTVILGKRVFTGRQYIWLNLWEYLQQNKNAYLWGVGYNTELYSRGTFNMHNAYLAIFAQYGIPIFICFIWFIIRSFSGMYNKNGKISDVQFKCYQILLYALIVGFGEGILTYLPNMIFIAMAIGIGFKEKLEAI